ncbi:MAG: SBBP repeat-containing protein, partial [Candidatus Hermodarchaeota archaeon]
MKNRKTFLMALIVILYFSIIFPFLAASNSATVKWYRTWGGSSEDIGGGVAVDSFDNVYISGWTRSFDPGFFSDLVLVKYDSSGVQQWNHTWGGVDDEAGWGVAVDSS